MAPRGCLLARAAAAATAALLLVDAAQACPSFSTKASTSALEGGKNAKLTVKIANRGATAVTDAGLVLTLPYGFSYRSAAVSPKPNPAPTLVQDGSNVAWTGLSIPSGKSRKVRVKLALDQCAGDTLVPSTKRRKAAKGHRELAGFGASSGLYSTEIGIATFTGPVNNQQCLSSTTVEATVRRPKTATNCAPPGEGDVSFAFLGLCSIPSGTSADGKAIYGCGNNAPAGPVHTDWAICGNDVGQTDSVTLQECMDFCAAIPGAVALMYYIPQTTPFCNCFDASQFPSQFRYVDSVISFDVSVYVIGAPANPPVPTQECGSR